MGIIRHAGRAVRHLQEREWWEAAVSVAGYGTLYQVNPWKFTGTVCN